jgi:hypothetical protein
VAKVRAHTRTVRGRRQRVKPHSRKLEPRRAGHNARRAFAAARRKRHSDALVWGSVAAAEISAWLLFRTTGLTLTAIGLALIGVGIAARRMT